MWPLDGVKLNGKRERRKRRRRGIEVVEVTVNGIAAAAAVAVVAKKQKKIVLFESCGTSWKLLGIYIYIYIAGIVVVEFDWIASISFQVYLFCGDERGYEIWDTKNT